MRGLLMATLLSLAMPGFAQPPAPGQGGADGVPLVVPNTSVRTMQASGSGRGYQITVALPSRPPRQAGYPVIYVLDANIMLVRKNAVWGKRVSVRVVIGGGGLIKKK